MRRSEVPYGDGRHAATITAVYLRLRVSGSHQRAHNSPRVWGPRQGKSTGPVGEEGPVAQLLAVFMPLRYTGRQQGGSVASSETELVAFSASHQPFQ